MQTTGNASDSGSLIRRYWYFAFLIAAVLLAFFPLTSTVEIFDSRNSFGGDQVQTITTFRWLFLPGPVETWGQLTLSSQARVVPSFYVFEAVLAIAFIFFGFKSVLSTRSKTNE